MSQRRFIRLFRAQIGLPPGYGLRCEYEVLPEVFMVTELEHGALRGAWGLVRYDDSFANV